MIDERMLMERINPLLGQPFETVPCWKFLELAWGTLPPAPAIVVGPERLGIGDGVVFGEQEEEADVDATIGIYLGSGKVAASLRGYGVRIVPFRFVLMKFIRGYHFG